MSELYYYDPYTQEQGKTSYSAPLLGPNPETPREMYFDGRYLSFIRQNGDNVEVINTENRNGTLLSWIVHQYNIPLTGPINKSCHGICTAGRYAIFMNNFKLGTQDDRFVWYDRTTGDLVRSQPVNNIQRNTLKGIVSDGRHFYATLPVQKQVMKYSFDGELLDTYSLPTNSVCHSITYDGRYLWLVNTSQIDFSGGDFIVLDPQSGNIVVRIPYPGKATWEFRPGIAHYKRMIYFFTRVTPHDPEPSDEYNPGDELGF